jgi:hypothetical protein
MFLLSGEGASAAAWSGRADAIGDASVRASPRPTAELSGAASNRAPLPIPCQAPRDVPPAKLLLDTFTAVSFV